MSSKLSNLIRERANILGLSNAEIARRAGFTRSYIGSIINDTAPTKSGQYKLSPRTVGKLSKALQVSQTKILACLGYKVDVEKIDVSGLTESEIAEVDSFIEYLRFKKVWTRKVQE